MATTYETTVYSIMGSSFGIKKSHAERQTGNCPVDSARAVGKEHYRERSPVAVTSQLSEFGFLTFPASPPARPPMWKPDVCRVVTGSYWELHASQQPICSRKNADRVFAAAFMVKGVNLPLESHSISETHSVNHEQIIIDSASRSRRLAKTSVN